MRRSYVEALREEIRSRRGEAAGGRLQTIYMGGGTPSLLSGEELHAIFETIRECYTCEPGIETTIEANPDDVTPQWADDCLQAGINRVSLGVQTFDDELLRRLSRRHTAEQARRAVRLLEQKGFGNLSIDLIYGLPGQSRARWRDDLSEAFSLPVRHVSAYALSYEPGTAFFEQRRCGKVAECDEETSAAMYADLLDAADRAGFRRYEISNFARPAWESRHNSSYWAGIPYIGCGPSAHSYDGTCRRWNLSNLEGYVAQPGHPPYEAEKLTIHERYDEYVLTRLRMPEGVETDQIAQAFGPLFEAHFHAGASRYLRNGMLQSEGTRVFLGRSGLFVSDMIMSDLMWPD